MQRSRLSSVKPYPFSLRGTSFLHYTGEMTSDPLLLIVATVAVIWAVVVTGLLFVRNPLPFPDHGHRLYCVRSAEARGAVLSVLKALGLSPRFRFKFGPSDQTVFWDNTTVLHLLDSEFIDPGNALSVAVQEPERQAAEVLGMLTKAGFPAHRVGESDDAIGTSDLVVIASEAFDGWTLVLRRHLLRMPKPKLLPVE
jgi:hypothetical protein